MHSFDRVVSFWRERVPLTEVSYDELIADPEPQTRALVAAAGLPWDDACLDHTSASGAITTLSIAQARKPIYKSSSGSWRRHAAELEPFVKAWDAVT